MPELPEVEAVCRRLREALPADRRIMEARILRPSIARPQQARSIEKAVAGRAVTGVRRVGKHILVDLDHGQALHIHLRMTGNLYVIPDVRLRVAAARAWFAFPDGGGMVFEDARALGKLHLVSPGFAPEVGPEPEQLTAREFVKIARRHKGPVKLLLMDQTRIAGLGNLYAAEALFQAGIHPARRSPVVTGPKLERLHGVIVEMLKAAKESAYRAYTEPGYFAEGESFPVAVYDREGEPCPRCGRKIRRIRQGGRSTYYCPGCQR